MHPFEEFMLDLGDLAECYQHGGLLRLAQSGQIVVDSYHIENDLLRVKLLKKAGFLDYEIIKDAHGNGEDGMALYPTDKTMDAIAVYERTDIGILLGSVNYRTDDSYGLF